MREAHMVYVRPFYSYRQHKLYQSAGSRTVRHSRRSEGGHVVEVTMNTLTDVEATVVGLPRPDQDDAKSQKGSPNDDASIKSEKRASFGSAPLTPPEPAHLAQLHERPLGMDAV